MKNTLTDLNNYLFEQLERLNDDDLTKERLDRELQKADSVVKIAEKIIENDELAFKTMKHLDEFGRPSGKSTRSVPPMLTTEGEW